MNIWQQLGIDPTQDIRTVKRAYARRIKAVHPEDDPQGFQQLRAAYESALAQLQDEDVAFIRQPLQDSSEHLQSQPLRSKTNNSPPPRRHPEPDVKSDVNHNVNPLPERRHGLPVEHYISTNKAVSMVTELLRVTRQQGEKQGKIYLEQLLQSEALKNLDLKSDFEEKLLFELAQQEPLPMELLTMVANHFGWQETIRSENNNIGLDYLLGRLKARDMVLQLKKRLGLWHRWSRNSVVGRVLTGKVRLWYFRWLALSRSTLNLVNNTILTYEIHYPELLAYELKPEVVQWWRQAVIEPRIHFSHLVWAMVSAPFIAVTVHLLLEKIAPNLYLSDLQMTTAIVIPVIIALIYFSKLLCYRLNNEWSWMLKPLDQVGVLPTYRIIKHYWREWKQREHFSLRVLKGPLRLWWFRWLALEAVNLQKMRETLGLFDTHDMKSLPQEINRDSLLWWQKAVSEPRLHWAHYFLAIIVGPFVWWTLVLLLENTGNIPHAYVTSLTAISVVIFPATLGIIYGLVVLKHRLATRFIPWLSTQYVKWVSILDRNPWVRLVMSGLVVSGLFLATQSIELSSVAWVLLALAIFSALTYPVFAIGAPILAMFILEPLKNLLNQSQYLGFFVDSPYVSSLAVVLLLLMLMEELLGYVNKRQQIWDNTKGLSLAGTILLLLSISYFRT